MITHYNPAGLVMNCRKHGHVKLCREGHTSGWVLYKHADGQWVTLRAANDQDRADLAQYDREDWTP